MSATVHTVRNLVIFVALASLVPSSLSQTAEQLGLNPDDSTGEVVPVPNLTFTIIQVADDDTQVYGINTAGDIVGNTTPGNPFRTHGFLLQDGVFTFFDSPRPYTVPRGINDSGLIVGNSSFFANEFVGFVYDGTNFTAIHHGSDNETSVNGINNAGDLVGGSGTTGPTKTRGFEIHDGHFELLNVVGRFTFVYGTGINNLGDVVGWADSHGFMCRLGTCKFLDIPGADKTNAFGINDAGIIVGFYETSGPVIWHGFAWRNGKYISIDYPGAIGTFANGINNSGQIVGSFVTSFNSIARGFITSPITAADFR
jgi:uncharacterized membrane protein